MDSLVACDHEQWKENRDDDEVARIPADYQAEFVEGSVEDVVHNCYSEAATHLKQKNRKLGKGYEYHELLDT